MFAPLVRAASFSADLVENLHDQVRTSAFHYQDKSYRFERAIGSTKLVVIADASGATRVLVPDEKVYLEFKPGQRQAAGYNPLGAAVTVPDGFEARNEGTEAIEGFACRKVVITSGPQEILRAWFADELGLALRIQGPGGTGGLELKNVKPGPQDAALFALPAGYRLVREMPEPLPEWAGQVASAPRVTPPFERTLEAGGILRISPKAGFAIHLAAGNPGPDECTAVSVPFKDGRPLSDIRGNRFTLEPEQDVTTGCSQGPDQVDELVVRVERGRLKIKAEFVAASDQGRGAPPTAPASGDVEISAPQTAGVATLVAIEWQGPNGPGDFIAIATPGQPPGASITRAAASRGTPARLYAPSDPGEYEVRYVAAKPTKVLGKVVLAVAPATATVKSPESVDVAAPLAVTWEGPQTEGDIVSIARPEQPAGASVFHVRAKDGNPARLFAPSDAGEYEVRYVLGRGSRLLAKASITVKPVIATLALPAGAKAGANFEVRWTGPGYTEDFVCVVRADTLPGGRTLSAVRVSQGNPAKLLAPKEPGIYEVRYILGRGRKLLAQAPLTVE